MTSDWEDYLREHPITSKSSLLDLISHIPDNAQIHLDNFYINFDTNGASICGSITCKLQRGGSLYSEGGNING